MQPVLPEVRRASSPRGPAVVAWLAVAGLLCLGASSCGGAAAPASGRPHAPTLIGTTLDGTRFDLAAERGRWVVVAFEASTCVPCRKEIPDLRRFAVEHPDVRVVSVGVAETAANFERFLAPFDITWPAVPDRLGYITDRWDVLSLPVTVVVDPTGRVRKRFTTVSDRSQLAAAIRGT